MGILKNLSSVLNTASDILNSDAAKQVIGAIKNGGAQGGSIDIASGLKAALQVGIETAAKNLGAENGYLADAAVKIGLPKEAVTTFGAVQSLASNQAFNSVLNATGVSIPTSDTIITPVQPCSRKRSSKIGRHLCQRHYQHVDRRCQAHFVRRRQCGYHLPERPHLHQSAKRVHA